MNTHQHKIHISQQQQNTIPASMPIGNRINQNFLHNIGGTCTQLYQESV